MKRLGGMRQSWDSLCQKTDFPSGIISCIFLRQMYSGSDGHEEMEKRKAESVDGGEIPTGMLACQPGSPRKQSVRQKHVSTAPSGMPTQGK